MSNKRAVHAIVGVGTAPKPAILEALKDGIDAGEAICVVWDGAPEEGTALDVVYDYILDNDVEFIMFYADGTTPPRVFRESDVGVVQKVRNPLKSAVESVANKGKVFFLWDAEADDDQIDPVFEAKDPAVVVLELTNGLAPIIVNDDIPEPTDPVVESDPDDVPDDTSFTKDELENMAASAVKRYGARLGLKSATKSGIIAELFPFPEEKSLLEEEEAMMNEEVEEAVVVKSIPATAPDARRDAFFRSLTNVKPSDEDVENIEAIRASAKALGKDIFAHTPASREQSLALTHLEEAVMWAVKSIVLNQDA